MARMNMILFHQDCYSTIGVNSVLDRIAPIYQSRIHWSMMDQESEGLPAGELRRPTFIRATGVLWSMQRSYLNSVEGVPSVAEFEVITPRVGMLRLLLWTFNHARWFPSHDRSVGSGVVVVTFEGQNVCWQKKLNISTKQRNEHMRSSVSPCVWSG